MDCCNYMQFRHPYYDPQIFENGLYTRDYYGHPYQSYYTNPYYSQQWPCATPFTDYVYNPKEARIRKAMRESSRERTLGAGRTPSPRGRRQSQTWSSIPEEQLMMVGMGVQQSLNKTLAGLASTVCGYGRLQKTISQGFREQS